MRHSTRFFLNQSVDSKIIEQALNYARFAACSKNIQPWQIAVVSGNTKEKLSTSLLHAVESAEMSESIAWADLAKPAQKYWQRAKDCGYSLFQHKKIIRDDLKARKEHFLENYYFFHAPVEIIFYMHHSMQARQLIDMGIFLERMMASLHENGLASCPQASIASYPDVIRDILNITADFDILFGLAVGYEDSHSHVNSFRTEKLQIDEFTTWHN